MKDRKEKMREYRRKYREANPEKVREEKRKYHAAHPERYRESGRKYRGAHPERYRESKRKTRARRWSTVQSIVEAIVLAEKIQGECIRLKQGKIQ